LEVARGAFALHQGNCCFHILDFVVVAADAKKDAVGYNDAFVAQQFVSVQPLELTNVVDCKNSEVAENLKAALVTMTTCLVECYL
jgi:hypothetical protein